MNGGELKIRWARGFFRLWAILTIPWIIAFSTIKFTPFLIPPPFPLVIGDVYFDCGGDFYFSDKDEIQKCVDGIISETPPERFVRESHGTKDWPTDKDRYTWHLKRRVINFSIFPSALGWTFGIPLGFLCAGALFGWALRGFRREI